MCDKEVRDKVVCDKELCVKDGAGAAEREEDEEEERVTESKTRTPHKDIGQTSNTMHLKCCVCNAK